MSRDMSRDASLRAGGDVVEPAGSEPVQCALCGYRFAPTVDTMSCSSCPMNSRCRVICCPHCGYEFVTESKVIDFFRRIFRR